MAGVLKVNVKESISELEKSLSSCQTSRERERLQMLYWLKTGRVSNRKEIGQLLCRDEATITRWLQKYRKGGLTELLSVKKAPGKPRKIVGAVLTALEERLGNVDGFNSYGEIQEWLQSQHGIVVNYKTVHKTVRYRLVGKLKSPRPQSIKQNPEAQSGFKKN